MRELRDRRVAALGEQALTRRKAFGLRHLEHRRPTEVAALGALGGLEVLEAVATRQAGRAALEAFDYERLHGWSIGGLSRGGVPLLGD
jgi:hypothetical protein